jgi:hypothetical protein
VEHDVNEEQIPQHEPAPERATFTVSAWDDEGLATIEARGHDLRSTLEAGLRGVLALSGQVRGVGVTADKSAPVQGEGADHVTLFAALADDLLVQIDTHGAANQVAVDGVLRRDDGGYLAWGYLQGPLDGRTDGALPTLAGSGEAREDERGHLVLTARLRRGQPGDGAAGH